MSKVTREMIAAAHDVTMRHKIVLGHELLTEIYQAMDAKRGLSEAAKNAQSIIDSLRKQADLEADALDRKWALEMIAAIREALAEQPAQPIKQGWDVDTLLNKPKQPAQQQEPVAWMDGYRNIYSLEEKAAGCVEATIALVPMANQEKTSGSPINELQCVCGAVWLGDEMVHLPDKHPPASKPWVGLTPEEEEIIYRKVLPHGGGWRMFLREANAMLKEKNT